MTIATENVFGELLDLQASETVGYEVEAHDIVELLEERYHALWGELTAEEEFGADELWRIEQRIERLNDLGFDVDELDIVTDLDGDRIRIQPKVVELGHHQRELQALTGLHVEDAQARRLLNDLASFTAAFDLGREDRTLVANRWLTEIYEPIQAMVPAGGARQARARRGLPRDPPAPLVPVRGRAASRSTRSRRPRTTSTTCSPPSRTRPSRPPVARRPKRAWAARTIGSQDATRTRARSARRPSVRYAAHWASSDRSARHSVTS